MVNKLKNLLFENRLLFSVIFTASILLFWNVSARTFWMDETMVLNYFKYGLGSFFKAYLINPDNHPPLYYFLVLILSKFLPWTELTVRLVSILSGIGIVALVYVFTYKISKNKVVSFITAFFTAFSSFFVLISQMARYHSIAAFFSLFTFYFFYLLIFEEYKQRNLVGYLVLLLLTAYSDYPHFIYTAFLTNIIYIYLLIRNRSSVSFAKWFGGQFLAAVLCLPLAYMLYHRIFIQGDGGWSNLNLLQNSWLNIVGGVLFHFYVFIFGENIFPWNTSVFILGIVLLLSALFSFVFFFVKKLFSKGELYIILLTFLVIIINTLFMNKADPRYNFTIYPKFGFVAYPLFIMSLVFCLAKIKSLSQKIIIFIFWICVSSFGLVQFYSLNNYFNASYFRDFRSFDFVKNNSEIGEYLAITPDLSEGAFLFYENKYFSNLTSLDYNAFYSGQLKKNSHVWLFATGSDGPESSVETDDFVPSGYLIIKRFDSVPLDNKFKFFKEKFLNRQSYKYKYSVFLLQKI